MQISELKTDILNGNIKPFYIFIGPELALQDVYIDKISQVANLCKLRVDSLGQIYSKLSTRTLVKTSPKLYIIRDDEQYYRSEKDWDKLIKSTNLKGNIIILLYTQLDKRGKFYKQHEDILVEFDFIGPNILVSRLEAVTGWPRNHCADLVNICGCNYGRIQKELYNIYMLAKINKLDTDQVYIKARELNLIYEEIGDIIFDFSNAVINRDVVLSYKLLSKLQKTDEGPVKLITVLYNSFRNVLIVQCAPPAGRTEEFLGLSKAQIYVTSKQCNRYTPSELVGIIKLLQSVEEGIKVGSIDSKYAMEYVLGEIF